MQNLIRFVVVDENKLGYVLPHVPLSLQLLAVSVIRGASACLMPGTYPLPLDPDWVRSDDCPKPLDLDKVRDGIQPVKLDPKCVRPATLADFDFFRIHVGAYRTDPRLLFPTS